MKFKTVRGDYGRGRLLLCIEHGGNSLHWRAVLAHPIKAWRYFHGWREA